MIATDETDRDILLIANHINSKHLTTEPVSLTVAWGFGVVREVRARPWWARWWDMHFGAVAFGAYYPERRQIVVADQIPADHEWRLWHFAELIAHEYWHHFQAVNDRPFNEGEADIFADVVVEELLRRRA